MLDLSELGHPVIDLGLSFAECCTLLPVRIARPATIGVPTELFVLLYGPPLGAPSVGQLPAHSQKNNPDVLVMLPTEDRKCCDVADSRGRAACTPHWQREAFRPYRFRAAGRADGLTHPPSVCRLDASRSVEPSAPACAY
jgi:hypothetical protein